MFEIKTLDRISSLGLKKFDEVEFHVDANCENPDVILVRSTKVESVTPGLLAIGRAGIGVNNIPVAVCSENGVIVFNTPGANANAVKELVLTGLFLSSRDILGSVSFLRDLKIQDEKEFNRIVEKSKSQFVGNEIKGKKLGIVGLGSIGMTLANDALNLGMEVFGFDPFITVSRAWQLSCKVKEAKTLDSLLANCDFISLHIPLTGENTKLINHDKIEKMKKGAVILNFSRSEIIDEAAILDALSKGHLKKYVTDFPSPALLKNENVIALPHLGASTFEAEENCAMMIVDQVKDFLENGNIKNSVNFPDCALERSTKIRLTVANENIPNMVGQITTALAEESINIVNMVNKSKNNLAYNILELEGKIEPSLLVRVKNITGVVSARIIQAN
ncbi:MAG: 3-phosphoglycerate dehydrogenase family protein [Candidatus Margulisiibacteriota bacterium]|jgi:D-3-phosphoglycerate dehydrogenase